MTDEEFISLRTPRNCCLCRALMLPSLSPAACSRRVKTERCEGPMYLNTRLANALKRKPSLRRRPKMTSLRTAFGGKTWSAGPHAPGGG